MARNERMIRMHPAKPKQVVYESTLWRVSDDTKERTKRKSSGRIPKQQFSEYEKMISMMPAVPKDPFNMRYKARRSSRNGQALSERIPRRTSSTAPPPSPIYRSFPLPPNLQQRRTSQGSNRRTSICFPVPQQPAPQRRTPIFPRTSR